MRKTLRGSAVLAVLAAGGCGIARPLYDGQMAEAPIAACAAVNGVHPLASRPVPPPPAGEAPAKGPPQCFMLLEEAPDGSRREWSGGTLTPGRTLVAWHQPAVAGCGGRFTHLTLEGESAGQGQAELATWDPAGRPGHQRLVRWDEPFAKRTLALASIDSAVMAPAGARIRVLAGGLDPAGLCFKSY